VIFKRKRKNDDVKKDHGKTLGQVTIR